MARGSRRRTTTTTPSSGCTLSTPDLPDSKKETSTTNHLHHFEDGQCRPAAAALITTDYYFDVSRAARTSPSSSATSPGTSFTTAAEPVCVMNVAVANFAKLATATAPSSKRPVRQSLLSVREKIDAIDRVHEGESKAAVARDIGVPESTLRGWCKTEDKLRSLARACEGSDTPPSDLDKAGLDQDPYSPEPLAKRYRVESENKPAEAGVDDALLYWLKQQQQHVGLAMNEHLLDAKMATDGVVGAENSSWFWRWYKQYGATTQPLPLAERVERGVDLDRERELELRERTAADLAAPITPMTPPSPPSQDYLDRDYDAPLSLVKRERDSDKDRERDRENYRDSYREDNNLHLNHHNNLHHDHLSHLSHHVKDNLDNNNVTDLRKQPPSQLQELHELHQQQQRAAESEDEDDEPPETAAEAVKHGERFLRWLECCSDPSVTALQILQFRYLLNNVRACADRRSRQGKSKDRERSRRK